MNFFQRAFSYLSGRNGEGNGANYRISNAPLSFQQMMGLTTIGGKVVVTPESALGLTAVLNCHSNLSRDISSLPVNLYKKTDKGSKVQGDHPVHYLIHTQPNSIMTAQTWYQLVVWNICKYGNSFHIIDRNQGDNRPIGLWPIKEADIKKIVLTPENRLVYETVFGNYYGDDILHFKLLSDDGITGRSFISYQMDQMGLGLSSQKYGLEFYEKGAHYDVVISAPGKLSNEAKNNIKQSVDQTRKNENVNGNLKKTVVLEEGMRIERLSYSPAEAEFILTQKFTAKRIAGLYRMPLEMIGDLEDSNNSINENTSLNYVKYGLLPWLRAIEQELEMKLLRSNERSRFFIKMNVNALLRGDIATRFESYAKMLDRGVYNIDEVREWEDMDHVEGGDQRFVQANNVMPLQGMEAYSKAMIEGKVKSTTINSKKNGKGSNI